MFENLMFSGGRETDQWHEIGRLSGLRRYIRIKKKLLLVQTPLKTLQGLGIQNSHKAPCGLQTQR